MKISVLGMGYVGLSNATMLSTEYDVSCQEIDESILELIEKRRSPIQDKLISVFCKNKKSGKLSQNEMDSALVVPTGLEPVTL